MSVRQSEAKFRVAVLSARSSIHTVRWVNGLAARGYEVLLFSMHRGGEALDPRVQYYPLPFKGFLGIFLNIPALRRLLKKTNPQILHTHFASSYGLLARGAGFRPSVLSVWGSDVFAFPDRSFVHKWILQGNLKNCTVISSTSRIMKDRLISLSPKLESKISVIPFGVDLKRFKPGREKKSSESIKIGTIKSLEDIYGIDLLIRGFIQAKKRLETSHPLVAAGLKLEIYGKGSALGALQELTMSLGAEDDVEFAGAVDHSLVPTVLNTIDVFVAMSRQESFGVAVIEASACGVPVIVSDAGGLPEVVEDEVTGFIVPSLDAEALSVRLVDLIVSKELRQRLGDAGCQWVAATYDWEASLDQTETLYSQIMSADEG